MTFWAKSLIIINKHPNSNLKRSISNNMNLTILLIHHIETNKLKDKLINLLKRMGTSKKSILILEQIPDSY